MQSVQWQQFNKIRNAETMRCLGLVLIILSIVEIDIIALLTEAEVAECLHQCTFGSLMCRCMYICSWIAWFVFI